MRKFIFWAQVVFGLCLSSVSNAQTQTQLENAFTEYLSAHRQILDLPSTQIQFDPAFLRGRFFMLGEVHGIAHGQILDLAFLQRLHARAGVRAYLGEFDFAQAAVLDAYINGQQGAEVDAVFAHWKRVGQQWASVEHRTKWSAIRTWNLSLPKAQRISVWGADELQDRALVCRWLARKLNSVVVPNTDLSERLRDASNCTAGNELEAAATRLPLRHLMAFGSDPRLRHAIAALRHQHEYADREARMAANATYWLRAHPRKKAHGLWGIGHVIQAPVNSNAPLALTLMNQRFAVRSSFILNLDAQMMMPSQAADGNIQFGPVAYTTDSVDAALVVGIHAVKRAVPEKQALSMFHLTARGSPWPHNGLLSKVGGRFGEMQPFTIDYKSSSSGGWAQYLILSQGSAPTQAYGDR